MRNITDTFAAALNRVNVSYRLLPDPEAVDIFTPELNRLRADVEVAWEAGDEPRARQAIATWEQAHHDTFKEVRRG